MERDASQSPQRQQQGAKGSESPTGPLKYIYQQGRLRCYFMDFQICEKSYYGTCPKPQPVRSHDIANLLVEHLNRSSTKLLESHVIKISTLGYCISKRCMVALLCLSWQSVFQNLIHSRGIRRDLTCMTFNGRNS